MKRLMLIVLCWAGWSMPAYALDSYRFLHVTIDTPWFIFLFLLGIVLFPFILMAILYWRFAGSKESENGDSDDST